MTTEIKTTKAHMHPVSIPAQDHKIRDSAANVWRFILHFLEMLVAMMAGMPVFFMLRNEIPASSIYAAAFVRGTNLYGLVMGVFMTVPMVVWMIVRGHGWRHSAEMAFAMFAPVATLSLLGVGTSQPWISKVSHLGMLLGMLIAMLYRRDHYTGKAHHSAHTTR
jgi:flagellar biosynthetic protein FliP